MSGNNASPSQPASAMTDADFRQMLRRAMRTVAILGPILFVVFALTMGWQSGVLELAGAVISWTGLHEWRRLALAIFARLDNEQNPGTMGRTLVLFFLRLAMAVAILYVSLRCLHGNVYALVAGLGLAVVALSIEAVRLLR